jgi:hypothetical protein
MSGNRYGWLVTLGVFLVLSCRQTRGLALFSELLLLVLLSVLLLFLLERTSDLFAAVLSQTLGIVFIIPSLQRLALRPDAQVLCKENPFLPSRFQRPPPSTLL